jgi:hypothetical protein
MSDQYDEPQSLLPPDYWRTTQHKGSSSSNYGISGSSRRPSSVPQKLAVAGSTPSSASPGVRVGSAAIRVGDGSAGGSGPLSSVRALFQSSGSTSGGASATTRSDSVRRVAGNAAAGNSSSQRPVVSAVAKSMPALFDHYKSTAATKAAPIQRSAARPAGGNGLAPETAVSRWQGHNRSTNGVGLTSSSRRALNRGNAGSLQLQAESLRSGFNRGSDAGMIKSPGAELSPERASVALHRAVSELTAPSSPAGSTSGSRPSSSE